MTNKQLIKLLSRHPPDDIVLMQFEYYDYDENTQVTQTEKITQIVSSGGLTTLEYTT